MAWLIGWDYRKTISIAYSGVALTDYVMGYGSGRLKVHYGAGADDDDDFYLDSDCETDFGDVRFTADDGDTLLDYWIEAKTDSDWCNILVEVADIPDGGTTIYLYYGKAAETTTSDPDATFYEYEGFEDNTRGLFDRTKGNGAYVSITSPAFQGAEAAKINDTSSANYCGIYPTGGTFWNVNKKIIEFWIRSDDAINVGGGVHLIRGANLRATIQIIKDGVAKHDFRYTDGVGSTVLGDAPGENYYKLSFKLNEDDLLWAFEILDIDLEVLYAASALTMRAISVTYRDIYYHTWNAAVGAVWGDCFRSMQYVLDEPVFGEPPPDEWNYSEDVDAAAVLQLPWNTDIGKCHVLTTAGFTISGNTLLVDTDIPEGLLEGLRCILVDNTVEVEQVTTVLSNTRREIWLASTPSSTYDWDTVRIVCTWDQPRYSIIIDTNDFDLSAMIPQMTVREFKRYWREADAEVDLSAEDWTELTTYGLTPSKRYVEFKFEAYGEACFESNFQKITLFKRT